ncbi:MAG: shikimate dehydrogenase [Bacteroidaceae bacterium]|nr:shikimate dehydrogenase [Bacteroidaceae bacterium]MBO4589841.1 shikimate dehydrogenase [Bacteroidaceae bacterium]
MELYGIIGNPLKQSFSQKYFTEFFGKTGRDARYSLFYLESIKDFPALVKEYPEMIGLNVTIPYKQQVIPYLDTLDESASAIGAVNVIRVSHQDGRIFLSGHNSDFIGFRDSIKPLLRPHHRKALILGTGGASKAVDYALRQLGIETTFVSRTPATGQLAYGQLDQNIMQEYTIVVNTTPLGMFPDVDSCADIPYQLLGERHLCYDVVYNPEKTLFLQKAEEKGATIKNGLEMLYLQAQEAWKIWNPDEL